MKRTWVFHPVLFAIYPVVRLYSANLAIVPLSDVIRPLCYSLVAGLGLWLVLGFVLRSAERGGAATSAIAAMFFAYFPITGSFPDYVKDWMRLAVWGFATLVVVCLFAWKWKASPTKLLNVAGCVLLGFAVYSASSGLLRIKQDQARLHIQTSGTVAKTAERAPDIFYIILDGYGRSDAVKKYIGYDNSDFIHGLKDRGFYVAQGHSNYIQTEQSLSSSLNMAYLQDLLGTTEPSSRKVFDKMIDENQVAAHLRSHGYLYEAVTTGFDSVNPQSADSLYKGVQRMSLFEATLLSATPLRQDSDAQNSLFEDRRGFLTSAFDNLKTLSAKAGRPRFVFAHILAPHPPFVFGPEGEPKRQPLIYGLFDGDAYMGIGGTVNLYRAGYGDQAAYISSRVLQAIDALLAAGSKPIIIVQGDHGSKSRLAVNSLPNTAIDECFPNLNAYFVPDSIKGKLYPTITPVNSFRIILSDLFGENLPILPDRSYYSTWDEPFKFAEVTDKLKW